MVFKLIEKYRKEAIDSYVGNFNKEVTFRESVLETIFRPYGKFKLPNGKAAMTHLHPDTDKLHLPDQVYIADWRKYRVEDHPALVNFQKKCHAAGLHDPWLRNYAHDFYPNTWGPYRSGLAVVLTGCLTGFICGGLIFAAQKAYLHFYPIDYPHSPEYIAKYGKSNHHH